MKKQIRTLLPLLLLISVNIYSQGILGKLKDVSKKIEVGKEVIEKGKELIEPLTIISDINQENYYYISNISSENDRYCGKTYNIYVTKNKNNTGGDLLFSYYDGTNCLQSSRQTIYKDGTYGFLYFVRKNGVVSIVREITSSNKDIKDATKNIVYNELYQLKENNIFLTEFNDLNDYDNNNKTKKGKICFKIENGNLINEKGDVILKIEGENKQNLLIIATSLIYLTRDSKIAESLDNYSLKLAKSIENDNKAKFLASTKKCTYCNKSYTGESFGLPPYITVGKPCEKIIVVYKNACCSRKCAFDYCNQTH